MANQSLNFLSQLETGFNSAAAVIQHGLVLATSGGADSMALLHGAVMLWPDDRQLLTVAHINHGLRGADSDADEALVRESAARLGVRFELKILQRGKLENTSRTSLEEAARNARYTWLTETAVQRNSKFIATAHHAEDQAETILHNAIRGTGLRGLGGMPCSRPLSSDSQLIRPMLQMDRQEIDSFLRQHEIEFRHDKSNTDPRFTRNRIRNELLPLLKESFNAQAVKNLNTLSHIATETADCLDEMADSLLSKAVLHSDEHGCRLDVREFAEWPSIIVRQCMMLLWAKQGWPRQKMSYRHWVQLADLATGTSAGPRQFPGGVTISCAETLMRLSRDPRSTPMLEMDPGA